MWVRPTGTGRKIVGICGQVPSGYSEFVRFLIEQGIDSILKATAAVAEVDAQQVRQ